MFRIIWVVFLEVPHLLAPARTPYGGSQTIASKKGILAVVDGVEVVDEVDGVDGVEVVGVVAVGGINSSMTNVNN